MACYGMFFLLYILVYCSIMWYVWVYYSISLYLWAQPSKAPQLAHLGHGGAAFFGCDALLGTYSLQCIRTYIYIYIYVIHSLHIGIYIYMPKTLQGRRTSLQAYCVSWTQAWGEAFRPWTFQDSGPKSQYCWCDLRYLT